MTFERERDRRDPSNREVTMVEMPVAGRDIRNVRRQGTLLEVDGRGSATVPVETHGWGVASAARWRDTTGGGERRRVDRTSRVAVSRFEGQRS